ncbi:MAG: tRNA (adenosine(37)-N6)-threonylcarbamoyltransferase complex transferase subunit TsaD [Prevotellaceae bacterium]|jgi:N6-L-threonylcarbamoyladenine synthase|nr:tRNA (adenosine(37)-N6)-threonylcarbamoyltransferase complex transferase subunit TsaD [Prevotellaceae bacterium]
MNTIILGIESSCDDTSAAIVCDGILLSNVTAGQTVHALYGGVVPELASRAHQQNIIPVVDAALKQAGIDKSAISAVAFTRGPGLLGSLLVGTSFAKGLAAALSVPLIDVNHLQAHVLAHFIQERNEKPAPPRFPFLCLLVSGGNSQIILVEDYDRMKIVGQTIDDAAGEAFDKCAKALGLPYPGGPHVDRLAHQGSPLFSFNKPTLAGYNYSFSGLKTSFLYFLRDRLADNPHFIEQHKADLCASLQKDIISVLMTKVEAAVADFAVKDMAIAGGVSANAGLRQACVDFGRRSGCRIYIPKPAYTTDNAAMVAMAGYLKYLKQDFCDIALPPFARVSIN